MLHLTDERLAALADDEPNATEAEHLAACRRCAAERVSQRRLIAMANAARDHISPPLTDWSAISARLRDEGMLGSGGENSGRFAAAVRPSSPAQPAVAARPERQSSSRRAAMVQWGMRAAAAVALVVGGAAAGRWSMGTAPQFQNVAATTSAARSGQAPMRAVATGAQAGAPSETYPIYGSVDEALRAMEVAQLQYQYAASFIALNDTSARISDPGVMRERLAALDQIAATSRAALYRAPHDLVLNQFYLSTIGAREATLRQLGDGAAGGSRVARY